MPDTPKHPVTVGDLLTIGVDRVRRPATVADLVSALRADGVLVSEISNEELLDELKRRDLLEPALYGEWLLRK